MSLTSVDDVPGACIAITDNSSNHQIKQKTNKSIQLLNLDYILLVAKQCNAIQMTQIDVPAILSANLHAYTSCAKHVQLHCVPCGFWPTPKTQSVSGLKAAKLWQFSAGATATSSAAANHKWKHYIAGFPTKHSIIKYLVLCFPEYGIQKY